jgi:hypothetical protein
MLKIIFAFVLALVAVTSHAGCTRFKPDGSITECTPPATQAEPRPEQGGANACQLGGKLAHDAYLQVTYDAQRPSPRLLHYTVDYWGDMMVPKHDRAVAHKGVDYITERLRAAGIGKPWEGVVYEAAREFIVKECNK